MFYRVNKQKCIGCQLCLQTCPGATRIGADGKADIADQGKLEQCGGEDVCPSGAIEKVNGIEKSGNESSIHIASDATRHLFLEVKTRVRGKRKRFETGDGFRRRGFGRYGGVGVVHGKAMRRTRRKG